MAITRTLLGFSAAFALFNAGPAAAAELSGEAGVTSDYRYRGVSLSDGKPAVQASLLLEFENGFYGEIWSSTLRGPDVDARIELDLTAGYSLELSDGLSLDVASTYYVYPGETASNYVEGTVVAELSQGPLTSRIGFSYAPRQQGTEDDAGRAHANAYGFAGLRYELSKLPITLTADLGYERGAFDEKPHGGKWDWGLCASLSLEPVRFHLGYSGSDAASDALVASLFLEF